jgi:hypothetical protein
MAEKTAEEIQKEKDELKRLEDKNNEDMAKKGVVNPYAGK